MRRAFGFTGYGYGARNDAPPPPAPPPPPPPPPPPAPTFVSATGFVSATSDSSTWTPFTGLNLSDCVLAVFVCAADGDYTFLDSIDNTSGWTNGVPAFAGTDAGLAVMYKFSPTASETLQVSISNSEQFSGILIRINGAANIGGLGVDGSMDPPSYDAGVTRDIFWIAAAVADGNTAFSAAPAGYSNFTNRTGGGANGATAAIATRSVASDQVEDPGAFTGGGAGSKAAATIAVYTL